MLTIILDMRRSKSSKNIAQHEIVINLLRQIRTEAGLRQKDIAERLKVPQSYVSKYEAGERRLDLIEIRQICHAVGISLNEFVKRLEKLID
jgi:transcriptional regulator with XRE-family HTH domain